MTMIQGIPESVRALERDLRTTFGSRLYSLVLYASADRKPGAPIPTLAIVDMLTADDLAACAARVGEWHDAGLATPLLLEQSEFDRSLDAFPLELGSILAEHVVVAGSNPFEGLRVDPADLRRACERQARSHLLHLREGYLEAQGRGDRVADLIIRSAPPLAALVTTVARLLGSDGDDVRAAARHVESTAELAADTLADVAKLAAGGSLAPDEARKMFPRYLHSMDKLTEAIDRWNSA
jgi:hypothetical protein